MAIANAVSLAFGQSPSELEYNIPLLGKHLVNCLEQTKLSPFPTLCSRNEAEVLFLKTNEEKKEAMTSGPQKHERNESENVHLEKVRQQVSNA